MAPSTLSDQAARMARGAPATHVAAPPPPPPTYNLKGPLPAAPAAKRSTAGGMAIQIGAYASEAEAQRQLQLAVSK
ncbi:MAG TPA: hypothetical protein PK264_12970, partial [Hyphomicrobiaceae bacterium]|nr:hypothetical protein [Hyphomicrobiaceae bacterium]